MQYARGKQLDDGQEVVLGVIMMIVAVEPLCRGDEHAVVNAGLIASIRLAFPKSPVLFLAEERHLEIVQHVLSREGISGVEAEPIQIPPGSGRFVCRMLSEFRFCRQVLGVAKKRKSNKVIFCAVNDMELLWLKFLLCTMFRSITAMAILHTIMQSIFHPPCQPWRHLIWLRNVLSWGVLDRLKIVVPGESIRRRTLVEMPHLESQLHALELAYFFPAPSEECSVMPTNTIRFGFLGVATRRKGIDTFFRLAAETYERISMCELRPEFAVLGPLIERPCREQVNCEVSVPSPNRFLPLYEMAELTRCIHYAVFPYVAEEYQLVASAAFLDAIAHLKPVIALRNPFIEYSFEKMGDIGYLCDSYEEMRDVVLSILKEFPVARYRRQCENILRGRSIFEPSVLSSQLRAIVQSGSRKVPCTSSLD